MYKSEENFQVQWTLRRKSPSGKLFKWEQKIKKKVRIINAILIIWTKIPPFLSRINDWSSSPETWKGTIKGKEKDLVLEGSLFFFLQVCCASLRVGFFPVLLAVRWESVIGCSGSWLLSDVITARAVALLVRDALREGELVDLRSLFFHLQRGLWVERAITLYTWGGRSPGPREVGQVMGRSLLFITREAPPPQRPTQTDRPPPNWNLPL